MDNYTKDTPIGQEALGAIRYIVHIGSPLLRLDNLGQNLAEGYLKDVLVRILLCLNENDKALVDAQIREIRGLY